MILREVEVRNFMSLEHVRLTGLDRLTVLIGRNNVGKSAVFRAVEHLGRILNKKGVDVRLQQRPEALITDAADALEYRLVVELDVRDRQEFVGLLAGVNHALDEGSYLRSKFLTQAEFTFRSAPRQ